MFCLAFVTFRINKPSQYNITHDSEKKGKVQFNEAKFKSGYFSLKMKGIKVNNKKKKSESIRQIALSVL